MKKAERLVSRIVVSTCAISALVFTPFINIDPVAPPKMAVLGTSSLVLLLIVLFSGNLFLRLKVNFIYLLLILNLILIFAFSGANKVEQFYGTIGRNYGLLSQLSLAIICLASTMYYSPAFVANFKKAVILFGGINMAYGTIQLMGEDFVSNWTTTYANSTRGFFANPNHYSSFTAIAALASLSNIFIKKRPKSEQFGSFTYIFISIIHLYYSKSTQGPIVFGVGSLLLILIFLKTNSYKKTNLRLFTVATTVTLVIAILDIFQKLPWKSVLYSSTVSIRGDYWRAGINMGLNHPFFGVGLDKYLDWYRISRDNVTFSRLSSAEVTDSAHNMFIDYFAWGGFPLLVVFLILNLLVLRKILMLILSQQSYDKNISGLIVIYIAFLMQSLISPIHLGMAVWGWVAIGLILGFTNNANTNKEFNRKIEVSDKVEFQSRRKYSIKIISIFSISTILAMYISSAFMIQDMKFRSAIKQNSTVGRVYNAAYIWPKVGSRMAQASWLLYKNNEKVMSLKIALDAVKYSPNNYNAWLVLASRADLDIALKEEVLRNISRLEPRSTGIILLK